MPILPPSDMPDDYDWLPGSARFPLSDMGELAVRLGSLVSYDRRGEVVFADGFDLGLSPYAASTSGVGAKILIGSIYAGPSGYNCRMTPGTAVDKYALLFRSGTPLIVDNLGLELSFNVSTPFKALGITIHDYSGTIKTDYSLAIACATNELSYESTGPTDIPFAIIPPPIDGAGVPHTLKMVIARAKSCYLRVLYDDNFYDLSNCPAWIAPQISTRSIQFTCWITSDGVANRLMLANHIILTANEP